MPVVNKPGANGALATKEVAGKPADGQNLMVYNGIPDLHHPAGRHRRTRQPTSTTSTSSPAFSQDDYVLVASGQVRLQDHQGPDRGRAQHHLRHHRRRHRQPAGPGACCSSRPTSRATDVPFDSGKPALTAVLGNQVEVGPIQLGEAMAQIKAGKLTPLAGLLRGAATPSSPTCPPPRNPATTFPWSSTRAIAAPKGTPQGRQGQAARRASRRRSSPMPTRSSTSTTMLTPKEISGEEARTQWKDYAAKYKSPGREVQHQPQRHEVSSVSPRHQRCSRRRRHGRRGRPPARWPAERTRRRAAQPRRGDPPGRSGRARGTAALPPGRWQRGLTRRGRPRARHRRAGRCPWPWASGPPAAPQPGPWPF